MTTTRHYVVIVAILFETIAIALRVVTKDIFTEEIKFIVSTVVALKVSSVIGGIIILDCWIVLVVTAVFCTMVEKAALVVLKGGNETETTTVPLRSVTRKTNR